MNASMRDGVPVEKSWPRVRDRSSALPPPMFCAVWGRAGRGVLAAGVLCFVCLGWLFAGVAVAQSGGLYIAGTGFSFPEAVEQGLTTESRAGRFFVLALGDAVRGLSPAAPSELAEIRDRGAAAGALYLVCQRDLDRRDFSLADLVPGVVAVRGWPTPGSTELRPGELYYPGEDSAMLPESTELLRRLRSACS